MLTAVFTTESPKSDIVFTYKPPDQTIITAIGFFTGITRLCAIGIGLVGIGNIRAIIFKIENAIAVGVVWIILFLFFTFGLKT
jgi:hypothetical protein